MRAGGDVRRACHIIERPHCYAHDTSEDDGVDKWRIVLVHMTAAKVLLLTTKSTCICTYIVNFAYFY